MGKFTIIMVCPCNAPINGLPQDGKGVGGGGGGGGGEWGAVYPWECDFMKLTTQIGILTIGHFTVVCVVTWPCVGSEAGGDLVLIQTSLLFICKCTLVSIRTA